MAMTDHDPDSNLDERILGELVALRLSIDNLQKAFDGALRPVASALRMIYLVPMSLIFSGVLTWLFNNGKISEYSWAGLMVVLMTPFFGEGVRLALAKGAGTARERVSNAASMLILALGIGLLMAGCALTIPIGSEARFGEVELAYRPPAHLPEILGTQPKVLSDK